MCTAYSKDYDTSKLFVVSDYQRLATNRGSDTDTEWCEACIP